MSKFVKAKSWVFRNETPVLIDVSINPMYVSCYYQSAIKSEGGNIETTALCIGGTTLQINAPYNEFHEFFNNEVERGFSHLENF